MKYREKRWHKEMFLLAEIFVICKTQKSLVPGAKLYRSEFCSAL